MRKSFKNLLWRKNVVIKVSFIAGNHECSQCFVYLDFVYSSENSYKKRN